MRNKTGIHLHALLLAGCLFSAIAVRADKPGSLPDSSVYQLRSSWTSDIGHKIHLSDLQGKVRLVTMFFGNCQSTCPMVLNRLKSLESQLPKDWGNKAGFVMVTMDPRRDDSGSLAEYRRHASLSADRWTLLRGNEEDTRELAMILGVAFSPSAKNGGMEHNVSMVLLDRKGSIIRKDENLDDEPGQLKALRTALENEKIRKRELR